MPAILENHDDDEDNDKIQVLITGFGRFRGYDKNPSWSLAEGLHGVKLDLLDTKKVIEIQTIQTAVTYSHILDLIPRLHGLKPSSPEAKIYFDPESEKVDSKTGLGPQGNGSPFPEGYRDIIIPKKGYFDHIIHIGVGHPNHVAIETLGHKRGYKLPDVKKELAPITNDQSESDQFKQDPSEAEKREMDNLTKNSENIQISDEQSDDPIRGFGKGYEEFSDEEFTQNDVSTLVDWLKNTKGHNHVRQSRDPGHYCCDFIFYCSLCESKRSKNNTKVQFIHVPPLDTPYSLNQLQIIVKDTIRWICSQSNIPKQ